MCLGDKGNTERELGTDHTDCIGQARQVRTAKYSLRELLQHLKNERIPGFLIIKIM